jgi:N-methylhydantoinase A/oxoprolinase/acetone carboxylase beta subunit
MARVVIPPGAGVGSAIGFLRAPVAYEVTRSYYQRLSALDITGANALLQAMRDEAVAVVAAGAGGRPLTETRTAFMRYVGQGHEVGVELPIRVVYPTLADNVSNPLPSPLRGVNQRVMNACIGFSASRGVLLACL